MAEIYLAGGCFWGLEEYFSRIEGVKKTTVGYANGQVESTNYQLIHQTDHAETVHLIYDEKRVSLREILLYYFRVIDPLSVNKQGNDVGRQYRTGVYYTDEGDKAVIEQVFAEQEKQLGQKIAVELEPLRHYVLAEDYHQDYLKKNPGGYCHINVNDAYQPLVDPGQYERPTDAELKEQLTQEQYQVTQHSATERPFHNAYNATFEEGIYVDVTTGEPLFFAGDKFESGCRRPAGGSPGRCTRWSWRWSSSPSGTDGSLSCDERARRGRRDEPGVRDGRGAMSGRDEAAAMNDPQRTGREGGADEPR